MNLLPRRLNAAALALALSLSSHLATAQSTPPAATDVAVTVNGDVITRGDLAAQQPELNNPDLPADRRTAFELQAANALVAERLLFQEAQKAKLGETPQVAEAVIRASNELLAQAYVRKQLGNPPRISESQIDDFIKRNPDYFQGRRSFHYRTIAFATPEGWDAARADEFIRQNQTLPAIREALQRQGLKVQIQNNSLTTERLDSALRTTLPGMAPNTIRSIVVQRPSAIIIVELLSSSPEPIDPQQFRFNIAQGLALEAVNRLARDKGFDSKSPSELAAMARRDGLHETPELSQALRNIQRRVLAESFMRTKLEAAPKPMEFQVNRVISSRPELFTERQVFQIRELLLTPDAMLAVEEIKLEAGRMSADQLEAFIRSRQWGALARTNWRGPEQLSERLYSLIRELENGKSTVITPSREGEPMVVVTRLASRPDPIDPADAKAGVYELIAAQIQNQTAQELIDSLKTKASIVYAPDLAAALKKSQDQIRRYSPLQWRAYINASAQFAVWGFLLLSAVWFWRFNQRSIEGAVKVRRNRRWAGKQDRWYHIQLLVTVIGVNGGLGYLGYVTLFENAAATLSVNRMATALVLGLALAGFAAWIFQVTIRDWLAKQRFRRLAPVLLACASQIALIGAARWI
jgi:EpsD family peptidyl-prolyl cis-trans isomerase